MKKLFNLFQRKARRSSTAAAAPLNKAQSSIASHKVTLSKDQAGTRNEGKSPTTKATPIHTELYLDDNDLGYC